MLKTLRTNKTDHLCMCLKHNTALLDSTPAVMQGVYDDLLMKNRLGTGWKWVRYLVYGNKRFKDLTKVQYQGFEIDADFVPKSCLGIRPGSGKTTKRH